MAGFLLGMVYSTSHAYVGLIDEHLVALDLEGPIQCVHWMEEPF